MIPSAAKAGMVRPDASLALLCALLATPAAAGDRALIDFIGYSADGRYFAFEEYGIQDGSGFAYSDVYIVDLPVDKWMYGSPYHAQASEAEPDRPLGEVRAEARGKAADKLDEVGISEPVHLIALNGDGEPGDGLTLQFGAVGYGPGELQSTHTLSLEIFDASSPLDCVTWLGEAPKGYALTLAGEGESRELHRDAGALPRSRGCPVTYRIYGVAARHQAGTLDDAVAIVSVYPFGFEGPDRRFLAVPLDR